MPYGGFEEQSQKQARSFDEGIYGHVFAGIVAAVAVVDEDHGRGHAGVGEIAGIMPGAAGEFQRVYTQDFRSCA